jgi:hypothetical protein
VKDAPKNLKVIITKRRFSKTLETIVEMGFTT